MEGEKLICESVIPLFDGSGGDTVMAAGEPVVPGAFVWRGDTYPVLHVLEAGKGLGPCTHGSGERYVRKHWYRFASSGGLVFRVYFERRPRARGAASKRWWLYTVAEAAAEATRREPREHE